MKKAFLVMLGCCCLHGSGSAHTTTAIFSPSSIFTLYDEYPWGISSYYGRTVDSDLLNMVEIPYTSANETLYSLELSHTLPLFHRLRHWAAYINSIVQVAGNITLRSNKNQNMVYEFDPYLALRWPGQLAHHMLMTSVAIGEGISYTTAIANSEKDAIIPKRFLNYLMFEVTMAHRLYPHWQFIIRVHHRSGVFGLYCAKKAGSNTIGVGIRYLL